MSYNFNSRYISFSINCFLKISIILFSFAPWLALQSDVTRFFSKLLYGLWFVSFLLILFFGEFSKQKLKGNIFVFGLIIIFSILGILRTNIAAYFSQFLNLIVPICILIVFSCINNNLISKRDIQEVFLLLFICCFFNCVYAVYLVKIFDGDFSKLYISKAKFQTYNYLRNGKLRAFGFLNSAVIFSNYLSLVLVSLFFSLKKKKYFIIRLLFFILVLYSLLLSGSRTNIFALFVTFFLLHIFNKHRFLCFLASIFSIVLILLFVTLTSSLDLSALGRIKQYADAIILFMKNPIGYGIGYASFPSGVISFDCAILVALVNFGLIGFCYLLFSIYKAIKKIRPCKDFSGLVCDAIVLVLFLLSAFVNVIHLGFLSLTIIVYILNQKMRNL